MSAILLAPVAVTGSSPTSATIETMAELKKLKLTGYSKHTRPTLWKAENAARAKGSCTSLAAVQPVNVTTLFEIDPTGLSISQKSHTLTIEGYLRAE